MLKRIRSSLPIVIGLILASTVAIGCGRKTTKNESRPAAQAGAVRFQISQLVPQASGSEQRVNSFGVFLVKNPNGTVGLDTRSASTDTWSQYEAESALVSDLQGALQISMLDVIGRTVVGEAISVLSADLLALEDF